MLSTHSKTGQFEVGKVTEDWTGDARFYEYTSAADPIGSGMISAIPTAQFGADLYNSGETRMVTLDLSEQLRTDYPATSPSLLAHFIRITEGDSLSTQPNATSELYYIISGKGQSVINGITIEWKKGDFITLPAGSNSRHTAIMDSTIYYIVD